MYNSSIERADKAIAEQIEKLIKKVNAWTIDEEEADKCYQRIAMLRASMNPVAQTNHTEFNRTGLA